MADNRFMLVASFPDSIVAFRGELILALQAKGLEVHVAAPGIGLETEVGKALKGRGVIAHDIPLSRTGINPISDLRLMWILFALMRRIRPKVVFCYTIKPVVYGSIAARLAGVPRRFAMITGVGYLFTGGRAALLQKLVRRLYVIALGGVEKVFFQNPDDRALFSSLRILKGDASSVVVDGSGVDIESFSPAPFPTGPTSFLMIGRLLGDKGVREYAGAAQRLRQEHPEVCFRLAGWIDSNPDSIAMAELDEWSANSAIEYLGRLDDVRPAIANAWVYVLPSYREGTPRTVLEAMAMGRPIVTTDVPGCRETVVNGQNGLLVEARSVESLTTAMRRFILEHGLAGSMGARSRCIAVEKYDVHKVNAAMLREMGLA